MDIPAASPGIRRTRASVSGRVVAGSDGAPQARRLVNTLVELERLLDESSDPDNPPAERLVELLTNAQTIAVVGLSRNLEKPARRVPSYLAAKGFDVIPVNPHADRLLGRRSYATLSEVEEPVDLVLIFRPSEEAGPFVREAVRRKEEPSIWLQTGVRSEEEVLDARIRGRIVVQDLCIFRVHRVLMA
ncbi:MAG: CoA-binding protein [Gemmatimonadetes bacterium]|nr:CoA-binding protein [Gemmatimonadota bacterium]